MTGQNPSSQVSLGLFDFFSYSFIENKQTLTGLGTGDREKAYFVRTSFPGNVRKLHVEAEHKLNTSFLSQTKETTERRKVKLKFPNSWTIYKFKKKWLFSYQMLLVKKYQKLTRKAIFLPFQPVLAGRHNPEHSVATSAVVF